MQKVLCTALFLVLAAGAAAAQSPVPPDAVKELAPTGRLRAAINAGNVVLVQKHASSGVSGITVDLARELGRRLSVPVDLTVYDTAGKVTEAAKTGA
jgi:polar amino acid transport system substrate-binding protein